jgi:ankyrin repeat protein
MKTLMLVDRRTFLRTAVILSTIFGASALPLPARAQQLYDDFVLAIENDRAEEVKRMLARGMDPNTVTRDGDPVLLSAARAGNAGTVDVLLAARTIKVDARSSYGDTALMAAAINGHLAIIKKLRARGAEINRAGWTPLIYAATGGHDDVVVYLLAEGADINATSPNGTTAVMMAVRENRATTLELLLAKGANPNLRNQDGASAMDWAKRNEDRVMIEQLKRAGAKG